MLWSSVSSATATCVPDNREIERDYSCVMLAEDLDPASLNCGATSVLEPELSLFYKRLNFFSSCLIYLYEQLARI